jgi:hypothetical protein
MHHTSNVNNDYSNINKEITQQNAQIEDLKDNEIPPFIMTIDIDQGKSEKIKIFFDSNPEELAFDFCKRNNLDYNAMQYLSEEIKNVIANNIEPVQKKNQIQEMIKEENEEDEVPTEGNVAKNKVVIKEEGIKNEEQFKEGNSLEVMNKDEINIKKEELILQEEEEERNKNFSNKEEIFKDYFQTNPEYNNNRIMTSQENLMDKKRLNTDNYKFSTQQNFYDQNNLNHPLNQTKTSSHKNIFEKLYKDAENRRKFVRRNSEKIYRVKHDDSLSNLNFINNNKQTTNILTTQRSREKLNKNCNGVCRNSDGFYKESRNDPNENCTFRPKINPSPYYSKQSKERKSVNKEKPSLLRNYSEYISTCIKDKEEEIKEIKERYLTDEPCSFSPKTNNR